VRANKLDEPVYVISIAARMVEMHPQTLRLYERQGLIKPARSGSNRLYSNKDIERLRQIQRLTQEMGVNLAGVEVILNLLEKIDTLQGELEYFRQQRLPVPVGRRRDEESAPRNERPDPLRR
jgi:MerR family transcriptional regulator/heat shock protein HspR